MLHIYHVWNYRWHPHPNVRRFNILRELVQRLCPKVWRELEMGWPHEWRRVVMKWLLMVGRHKRKVHRAGLELLVHVRRPSRRHRCQKSRGRNVGADCCGGSSLGSCGRCYSCCLVVDFLVFTECIIIFSLV